MGSETVERIDQAMTVSKRRAVIGQEVRFVSDIDTDPLPNWDYWLALRTACVNGITKEVPFDA